MHTEHETTVAASARTVYDIVADVARWPATFAPTIHAEVIDRDGPAQRPGAAGPAQRPGAAGPAQRPGAAGPAQRPGAAGGAERIRIWALANGDVKCWTSRRDLDPHALRVAFRQEVSAAPVAAMSGEWILEALSPTKTRVVLTHQYRAVDDDPDNEAWIAAAVDRNSRSELAALAAAAESAEEQADGSLDFTDSVVVRSDVERVYDFLYRVGEWPRRLPHVARLDLAEERPATHPAPIQRMEMDTRTANGAIHTTKSIRVCFAPDRIVYKQVEPPPLMSVHIGEWRFVPGDDGITVSSRHVVKLRPERVTELLGAEATLSSARDFVHKALSTNSMTTLRAAKAYAEGSGDA